ncbi:hypothetical protein [Paenibacillus odorifer]|uniref:hypothetical protein n=1 Tax=Paenibacillus odorifer TaxID=189426 RepID=UPI00096E505C|nr:hypothetical protein [Paenibacillus odorifer]OMD71221.1 hypothetical protein BSK50_26445 [Paenibacillus odorifer]
MKAKFHDVEVEGTPEEISEFKLRLEQNYQNAIYINTYHPIVTESVSVKTIDAIKKNTLKKLSF